jgi:segregation and condensation protein A
VENQDQRVYYLPFEPMSDLPIAGPGQKTGYRVRLAVFEGPLDLLLHLIEREELDITRISLALVTDQYLQYLSALEEQAVDDLTDFVVVAARLLLIKSQALLPRPPTPSPEKDEDAGDELLRQLLAYKRFKAAAKHLEERQLQGQRSYVRLAPRPYFGSGTEHLEAVPLAALVAAAQRALQSQPSTDPTNGVIPPFSVTIDDQIELITSKLIHQAQLTFSGLLTATRTRQEVIVTLMALLELIKREEIQARQERMFGEIIILPLYLASFPNPRSNPSETKP